MSVRFLKRGQVSTEPNLTQATPYSSTHPGNDSLVSTQAAQVPIFSRDSWWNVVNWDDVGMRFDKVRK
ncbi:MAG TPA: hypothetical protein VNA15_08620 [Candidatus Angelobacter sp.]|nr:hypothetical protein [Candidatus Angelobacter sp.]